jgi:hypothetical protein
MPIVVIAGVTVVASVVASFTDWLFMDVLVRRYYSLRPELWRPGGQIRRIVVSQLVGTLATAAAVVLTLWCPGRPVSLAVAAFCAGALPVELQQLQWLRLHPAITASHAAGWLVRLLIATLLASRVFPG